MEIGHKWRPIEDLPADWMNLRNRAFGPVMQLWRRVNDNLVERGLAKQFLEMHAREWAIETGIIENIYTIDRGATAQLILHGISPNLMPHGSTGDKSAEEVTDILGDHKDALEMVFDFVKQARPLSKSFIWALHGLITKHQTSTEGPDQFGNRSRFELLKGQWKKWPNSPVRRDGKVHEYCPPEQVDSEMDRLLDLHRRHTDSGVPPDVEAAWMHHRFVQIHPFQDGNGRVARCLATLVLLKAGDFPFIVRRDERSRYLDSLEAADEGKLRSFIQFIAADQIGLTKKGFEWMTNIETGAESSGDALEMLYGRTQISQALLNELDSVLRLVARRILEKLSIIAARLNARPEGGWRAELDAAAPDEPRRIILMLFGKKQWWLEVASAPQGLPACCAVSVNAVVTERDTSSAAAFIPGQVLEPFLYIPGDDAAMGGVLDEWLDSRISQFLRIIAERI
ncbi:hypothetical protein BH09SUM1_BH09SUM1_04180 [soil metagenome]